MKVEFILFPGNVKSEGTVKKRNEDNGKEITNPLTSYWGVYDRQCGNFTNFANCYSRDSDKTDPS